MCVCVTYLVSAEGSLYSGLVLSVVSGFGEDVLGEASIWKAVLTSLPPVPFLLLLFLFFTSHDATGRKDVWILQGSDFKSSSPS